MRIATRIAAGYFILIGLTVAALVYELSLIRGLQSINRDLAEQINARTLIFSLQVGDLNQIEEFTRKFFLTADPAYSTQLKEMRELFAEDFRKIGSMNLSEAERVEIGHLARLWTDFSRTASRSEQTVLASSSPANAKMLSALLEQIGRLRIQTDGVVEANARAIRVRLEQSTSDGRRAESTSRIVVAVALIVGLGACFLIVRSIPKPLGQLTAGTRAVAGGKFSYRLNQSGNHEFSWLARDFNRMTARLDELDQMKKDFISHVSHELKTPLASIQETHRLLLEEIPGELNEKQRRLLQLGLQSSVRLFSMIRDLLDLSRIEAGAMDYDFSRQDLVALTRAAVEEFEVQTRAGNHPIEVDLPDRAVMVRGDRDHLMQVIGNLLSNALKFSPKESPIQVRVTTTRDRPGLPRAARRPGSADQNGEFALISVLDRGPGVPHAFKETIFEKFQQVRQEKKAPGQGVGLGLSICRATMEAHQGAVWVEDNPKGGSVFHVLLPTSS